VRGRCEAGAVQAKVANAPKPEVVTPNPCSFVAHRDATNPSPPLKQVSPSPSPDGCCGGLRTTCAPTMSNLDLVPAALIPSPFAGAAIVVKPEPLAGVALHHGVGTGPAKSDAAPVYIFFTAVLSHSLAVFPSTAPSSPPCPGAQGEPQPPSPCCGPGLRAEAGPSLVSSLYVARCPLAPPRRPVVA
jgi:hypothetical protein